MEALARSKSMATALRKALAERHVDLSHSACLEIVARQFGFSDWNVLKAACDGEMTLSLTVFIEHGREHEAAAFYAAAFGAVQTRTYVHNGELTAFDVRLGDTVISVGGSNPRREAEPARGGPFFPKDKGAVSTIYRVEMKDAEAVLKRAVEAGATVRDELQISDQGTRTATFFDPFGHIWAVVEPASGKARDARRAAVRVPARGKPSSSQRRTHQPPRHQRQMIPPSSASLPLTR